MHKLIQFPEDFRRIGNGIQALREEIRKGANANAIGGAAALVHLDFITRIIALGDQLDAALGYELLRPDSEFEENLPRMSTTFRMLGELNAMVLGQITGLLNCFGGPAAIAIQQLGEWAKDDPVRQQYLKEFLAAAVGRAKRSRR